MKTLSVGDRVTVRSDIYLGQWLVAGGKGVIVRLGDNGGQTLYHVDIAGVQYTFTRGELCDGTIGIGRSVYRVHEDRP